MTPIDLDDARYSCVKYKGYERKKCEYKSRLPLAAREHRILEYKYYICGRVAGVRSFGLFQFLSLTVEISFAIYVHKAVVNLDTS